MTNLAAPQLNHMAVFARDMAAMESFYAAVLGLVVSNQGRRPNLGVDLVIMTEGPDKHHQFVLVAGRSPDAVGNVQQVSFLVADLAALRRVHARALAAGVTTPRCVSHGDAFSAYFPDPEGNTIEIHCETPCYVPQPYRVPIDLARPDHLLAAENDSFCRALPPGFLSRAEWQAVVAARIRTRLAA